MQTLQLTICKNLLFIFERLHNARLRVAKAQLFDAMTEVGWNVVEHEIQVEVALREVQRLPSCDVEISADFVERQDSVNATGVVRIHGP